MPTSQAQGAFCILFMPRRRTTRAERDKYGDAALLATEPWRQAAGSGTEEQRGNIRDRGRAHTVADSGQRLGDDPAILRLEIWCHAAILADDG